MCPTALSKPQKMVWPDVLHCHMFNRYQRIFNDTHNFCSLRLFWEKKLTFLSNKKWFERFQPFSDISKLPAYEFCSFKLWLLSPRDANHLVMRKVHMSLKIPVMSNKPKSLSFSEKSVWCNRCSPGSHVVDESEGCGTPPMQNKSAMEAVRIRVKIALYIRCPVLGLEFTRTY